MSLVAMTWAIQAPISRPTAKLALVCLADHADEDGLCFPSQKALAAKVGVTDRALRDALCWLEAEGFITRARRERKDGSRTSDSYQLPEEAYRKNFPHPRKQTQDLPEDISDLTSFEPVTEPTTVAAAPANAFDDLQAKLLGAAGIADFRSERSPRLVDLSPIIGLVEAGYDLETDILPAVRSRAVNGFRPRGWGFYVDVVREQVAKRKGIAAQPKPGNKPVDWPTWIDSFVADRTWKDSLGPRPDEPGCKAPPDLVAQARQHLGAA